MERELALRITVLDPPKGVTFCLQRGKTDLVPPARNSRKSLSFDFSVRVRQYSTREPNFLGPFTQGPPEARFVYVNSGTMAGQADSCWTRRAKVPLSGISWELIEQALAAGGGLEARIEGTTQDGGPACATVPLLDGGWKRFSSPQGLRGSGTSGE